MADVAAAAGVAATSPGQQRPAPAAERTHTAPGAVNTRLSGSPATNPPTFEPDTSMLAKALHALWWAELPFESTAAEIAALPHTSVVAGADGGTAVVVNWQPSTRALVLSFRAPHSLSRVMLATHDAEPLVKFPCIAKSTKDARVHRALAVELGARMGAADGSQDNTVFHAVKRLVGETTQPNSITCTGYSTGGSIAALAVVRMALRFATSDTCFIAFGSPYPGNEAYALALSLLVGLSFRVRHVSDPFTCQPGRSPWSFPATSDVVIGSPWAGDPWDSHLLKTYRQTLLAMAAETDLPRNAPGVYLLFPPKVLLRPGMQDLGIDDYFVPGATNAPPPPPEGQRNPSPYDATLLLAGGRFTIAQLFEPLGPIWNPTRGRLGTEGSMEDAVVAGLWQKPERAPSHQRLIKRFLRGGWGIEPRRDKATAAAAEAEAHAGIADGTTLPYLAYPLPSDDMAGLRHALDVIGLHRLPLPLNLSAAAYRDSPTKYPQEPSPPQPDPFFDYIHNNLGPHKVLAYRLLDDTEFKGVEPVTSTQAYVLWLADGTAIFAFRGTESTDAEGNIDLVDWKTDLDFTLTAVPGSNGVDVHRGFLRAFCSVAYHTSRPVQGVWALNLAGVLHDLIAAHPAPGLDPAVGPARVMCCGHSLGGALATLCAAWAAGQFPMAQVSMLTFGQPRVGNTAFAEGVNAIQGTVVRAVDNLDVVPTVPLHVQGFQHVYPAGMIRPHRRWTLWGSPLGPLLCKLFNLQPPKNWDFRLAHEATRNYFPRVTDHYLENYHARLKLVFDEEASGGRQRLGGNGTA